MISGKSITLMVGGSIAAYKSAELVRELVRLGAKVHVVMSKAACEFISPLTMQTLSGNTVTTSLFDLEREGKINHITLADSADAVIIAPASADIIAKTANGIADDSLSTILLATKAPVLVAPAMNVNMWENSITQANVTRLKEIGYRFVDPGEGELACGWFGAGRLAEIDAIVDEVTLALTGNELKGSRVIVTAGPTREPIDPIRFVSNRSTGKMGYAIARAARYCGAKVTLISGPTDLSPPHGTELISVTTAPEMREAVMEQVFREDVLAEGETLGRQIVYMVAAVTDHRPADASDKKLKYDKTKGYDLRLEPSPDILQELGERREEIQSSSKRKLTLVGFTAETGDEEELLAWAKEKLIKKNTDLMVGNFAGDSFGRNTNRVWLLESDGRHQEIATADKHFIAGQVVKASLKC